MNHLSPDSIHQLWQTAQLLKMYKPAGAQDPAATNAPAVHEPSTAPLPCCSPVMPMRSGSTSGLAPSTSSRVSRSHTLSSRKGLSGPWRQALHSTSQACICEVSILSSECALFLSAAAVTRHVAKTSDQGRDAHLDTRRHLILHAWHLQMWCVMGKTSRCVWQLHPIIQVRHLLLRVAHLTKACW
jgi:hypothetical protein